MFKSGDRVIVKRIPIQSEYDSSVYYSGFMGIIVESLYDKNMRKNVPEMVKKGFEQLTHTKEIFVVQFDNETYLEIKKISQFPNSVLSKHLFDAHYLEKVE